MKIIDPHLHLFDLQLGEYDWLKAEEPPFWPDKNVIQHNFSEQDLIVNPKHEIVGFIHVEAGFNNQVPGAEIQWLTDTVKRPFKAIACIDLTLENDEFESVVKNLVLFSAVSGVRHILDENAFAVLSLPQVQDNFKYVESKEICFELQMSITDTLALQQLSIILKACPNLKIILNHAGWPPVTNSLEQLKKSDWFIALEQLATFPLCAVKCSGWEMTDRHYDVCSTEQDSWLSNVLSLCLHAFGQHRVMLASNFPLCLFHSSYLEYWNNIMNTLDQLLLTEQKKQALVFNNACSWYNLNLA